MLDCELICYTDIPLTPSQSKIVRIVNNSIVIQVSSGYTYHWALEELCTLKDILRLIHHLSGKTWITKEVLYDVLVYSLNRNPYMKEKLYG